MRRVVWDIYFSIVQTMLDLGVVVQASRTADVSDVATFIAMLKPVAAQDYLVRIGGNGDGGYLVPDDLEGIEYCFSPGVSDYAPFESELEQRGITSFLADHSVDRIPDGLARAHFIKKFIGARNNSTYSTLDTWMEQSLPDYAGDLILQMDIEGSEYEAFMATSLKTLARFRIIVLELHHLHRLFDSIHLGVMTAAMAKLTANFNVVHLHPNNFAPTLKRGELEVPDVLEVTFLRKDRVIRSTDNFVFPHPLDRRCSKIRRDYALPACWYL